MSDPALLQVLEAIRRQTDAEMLLVLRADLWRARMETAAALGLPQSISILSTDITGDVADRVLSETLGEEDLTLPLFVLSFPHRVLMSLVFETIPAGVFLAARRARNWTEAEHSILQTWKPILAAPIACSILHREWKKAVDDRDEIRRKLAERKLLERAKGVMQARLGISEEKAYFELRRIARQSRVPLAQVAAGIVEQRARVTRAG